MQLLGGNKEMQDRREQKTLTFDPYLHLNEHIASIIISE